MNREVQPFLEEEIEDFAPVGQIERREGGDAADMQPVGVRPADALNRSGEVAASALRVRDPALAAVRQGGTAADRSAPAIGRVKIQAAVGRVD